MNYLDRAHRIASEIRREHRNGLVFQRHNRKIIREAHVSSIGTYHSTTLGRDVFIGLAEYPTSSSTLKTAFNIVNAEMENSEYRKLTKFSDEQSFSPVPSAFFILLRNRRGEEAGMLFEDVSHGGEVETVEPDHGRDPLVAIKGDRDDPDSDFSYILSIQTGIEVGDAKRVVDFSPLIPATVNQQDPEILAKLQRIIFQKELPVIKLRREVK